MPTFVVTAPNGKKYRVTGPEGSTPEQALEQVKAQVSAAPPSFADQHPNLDALARSPGLAGRYLLEGATGLGQVVGDAMDGVLNLAGVEGQHFGGNLGTTISDAVGLPAPKNAGERIVGDASRALSGAMTLGGPAASAANRVTGTAKEVLTRLGANLDTQAAAAVSAGGLGGAVREGGGGPIEQFAAAILGGVGGGMAFNKAQNIWRSGKAAFDAIVHPRDVAGRIEVELQRAGVDWKALSTEAKTQLVKDAREAVYSGQSLKPDALRRLADYRNIGAKPTTGEITQDPRLITQQRNLAKVQANAPKFGGPDLADMQYQNAKRVLSAIEGVESSADDAFTTGSKLQSAVRSKDATLQAGERALYSAARDTQGRAIPLDREAFVREAYDNLIRENKGNFLPAEIGKILEEIRTGTTTFSGQRVPTNFDVNTIDQFKTTLATASRGAKDGNVRAAIKAVRDALENVQPTTGQFGGQQVVTGEAADALRRVSALPAESLKAFDAARSASRQRFQWQESAPFIEDALSGADPQTFVKRHITGAGFAELKALASEVKGNPELIGSVRKQLADYILQRGRASSDTVKFSSAGMDDAFRQIGEQKLALFFSPQEIAQLKSAINVGRYMQSQPIGSAVNNSNTGALMLGRALSEVLKGTPILGPMAMQPAANAITGVRATFQARQADDLARALVQAQARQPRLPPAALAAGFAVHRRKDDQRH